MTDWGYRRSSKTHVFLNGLSEHLCNISAFSVQCTKAFGPTNEFTMIDSFLIAWIGELRRTLNIIFISWYHGEWRTVNPKGNISPGLSSDCPSSPVKLVSINVLRHSAQKSKSFWPSSCFCSSVSRYFVWVISNLPSPCKVTRQTRRFVPPVNYWVNWDAIS